MTTSNKAREKLQKVLTPREMILYESTIHGFAYVFPAILVFSGLFIAFAPELDVASSFRAEGEKDLVINYIRGMRETHYDILMMGIGLALLIKTFFDRMNMVRVVTNKRVIERKGTVWHTTQTIWLHRIREIKLRQLTFDHLLNRGRLILIGKEKEETLDMRGVPQPRIFREAIVHAQQRFNISAEQQYKQEKKKNR